MIDKILCRIWGHHYRIAEHTTLGRAFVCI